MKLYFKVRVPLMSKKWESQKSLLVKTCYAATLLKLCKCGPVQSLDTEKLPWNPIYATFIVEKRKFIHVLSQ